MSYSAESYIPMFDIHGERMRGVGILSAVQNNSRVVLPLADVRINASIAGQIACVAMTQKFQNPYSQHLEATYTFPLPGGAAVSDFEMKVGQRIIKGKVEERGEARRQYQQAINEGKRAAMMEKERDDVFTVQVGNLPPGEEISIKITYSEPLPFFEDGTTEMRLPLVVAPRYIPGQSLWRDPVGDGIEQDTNLVPDASRISPPRLAKTFDPAVSLGIEVVILWDNQYDEGDLRNLTCSQHAIRTSAGNDGVKVSLARHNEALDRDFVLRWTLSSSKLRTSMLVHHDAYGDNYAMLSLIPPYNNGRYPQARDIVFVLDRSGSMQGVKMASATRACALLLNTLSPQDRFAIQSFSNDVQWLNPPYYCYGKDGQFIPADYYGIEQGQRYLRSLNSDGGTEMYQALNSAMSALEQRRDGYRRVPVIVLLTDGEVGNESQILKEVQQRIGAARLFTIGIDTAVNEGFLKRLASVGSGTATFVAPGAQLEDALVSVGREIGSPLVVNLRVEDIDSGLELSTIAPSKIPDLFTGRASCFSFVSHRIGRVRVRGRFVDGGEFSIVVNPKEVALPAIGQLWAKNRISDLEDRYRVETFAQETIKREIITLSTRFNILTRFTAFIAVDHSQIVNWSGHQRHVTQPVEMPAQWEMEKANSHQNIRGRAANITEGATIAQSLPMDANCTAGGYAAPSYNAPNRSSNASSKNQSSPKIKEPRISQSVPQGQPVNVPKPSSPGLFGQIVDAVKNVLDNTNLTSQPNRVNDLQERDNQSITNGANSNYQAPNTSHSYSRPQYRSEREILEEAIRVLQEIYTEVYNGYYPSITRLDSVRQEVMEMLLRNSNLRQRLQRVFRFFDVEIHDLIGGLKQQNPRPFFDQHRYAFQGVVDEIRAYFGGAITPPSRKNSSFWESGI